MDDELSCKVDAKYTVVTHNDADGVLCLTEFLKSIDASEYMNVRSYFTTPNKVRDTICISTLGQRCETGSLKVFDLTANRGAIIACAMYKDAVWIDHHTWEKIDILDDKGEFLSVKTFVDASSPSAASFVSRYYKVSTGLEGYIDEIDKNRVETKEAKMIRDVIGAIKYAYFGLELSKQFFELAVGLAKSGIDELRDKKYNQLVENYEKFVRSVEEYAEDHVQITKVKGGDGKLKKLAILESDKSFPVHIAFNKLVNHKEAPFDVFAVLVHTGEEPDKPRVTKAEFRTMSEQNVYKIARFFGGGGHRVASGATVEGGLKAEELVRAIMLLDLST